MVICYVSKTLIKEGLRGILIDMQILIDYVHFDKYVVSAKKALLNLIMLVG